MKYYLIYALAFLLLGWAVEKMLDDVEEKATYATEKATEEAWSRGFERGTHIFDRTPNHNPLNDEVQRSS